jgi:hypothetical protein
MFANNDLADKAENIEEKDSCDGLCYCHQLHKILIPTYNRYHDRERRD